MFQKIAYTYYCVQDMDRAVDFYRNVLGLNLLFKGEEWSEFEIGGQRVALHKSASSPSTPGGAVVCFEARPIEDAIEKLTDQGVRFVQELQVFPYGKSAAFLDPQGNLIGLYEPPPKSSNGR